MKIISALSFINSVNTNPKELFKLAAIGFQPKVGLSGEISVLYLDDKDDDNIFPEGLVVGLKFVAMRTDKKTIGSFMLVKSEPSYPPFNLTIPLAITSAFSPNIKFPKDGHLRWRTSAPETKGDLYGFLTHDDQTLVIDAKEMNLGGNAKDIQVVHAAGVYHITIPTDNGDVFEAKIRPEDIRTNDDHFPFMRTKTNITAVLTVPHNGEMVSFYGTKNGVLFGNEVIKATKGLNVTALVVDSERPRMFIQTSDGKIYALPVDDNFSLTSGHLINIDDRMRTKTEGLFAGPAIKLDNDTIGGLIAIDWIEENKGHRYVERRIHLHQLPPIPSVNPRL